VSIFRVYPKAAGSSDKLHGVTSQKTVILKSHGDLCERLPACGSTKTNSGVGTVSDEDGDLNFTYKCTDSTS
jgi:hypothetical protein